MEKKGSAPREGVPLTEKQDDYLLPHFFLLLIGKPGSGKSHCAKQLLTSDKFYKGKFDYTIVVSPSVQKLGIPVKKIAQTTSYNLPWIFEHIDHINQAQVKRMQLILRQKSVNKTAIPTLPQEVIQAGLDRIHGKQQQQQPSSAQLPNEYISFNKNQRFFSIEILAAMNQGFQKPKQDNPREEEKKRSKGVARPAKIKEAVTDQKLQNVDEIEKQLVSKLTPEEKLATQVNVILVLDDVIGDIKSHENDRLQNQLIFNRRHLVANGVISIILVSQKYTMIPARIRSNANWMILFRLNPVDFDNVYKDVVMVSPNKWNLILNEVFAMEKTDKALADKKDKKYDSLGIWVEYDMFFKNFEKLTL